MRREPSCKPAGAADAVQADRRIAAGRTLDLRTVSTNLAENSASYGINCGNVWATPDRESEMMVAQHRFVYLLR
jgi:hypothetical protein